MRWQHTKAADAANSLAGRGVWPTPRVPPRARSSGSDGRPADEAVLTGAAGHPMRRRWGASLPPLRDAPTVSVLGDTEHLGSGWRRFLRLGVAEAEVVEDTPDRPRIGHERDHAHALATTSAHQRVDLVDLRDQPYAEFGIRSTMPSDGFCRVAGVVTCYLLGLAAVRARGRVIGSA